MDWWQLLLTYLIIVVLWQIGGQCWKAARRFGIPLVVLISNLRNKKDKKKKYIGIALLSLVLSMGYGVNSKISKLLKPLIKSSFWLEVAIRFVYSLFVCLTCLLISGAWLPLLFVIGAFQIRAGGIKLSENYDFLFEDLFRATAVFIACFWPFF
jgi:hypothetical protein